MPGEGILLGGIDAVHHPGNGGFGGSAVQAAIALYLPVGGNSTLVAYVARMDKIQYHAPVQISALLIFKLRHLYRRHHHVGKFVGPVIHTHAERPGIVLAGHGNAPDVNLLPGREFHRFPGVTLGRCRILERKGKHLVVSAHGGVKTEGKLIQIRDGGGAVALNHRRLLGGRQHKKSEREFFAAVYDAGLVGQVERHLAVAVGKVGDRIGDGALLGIGRRRKDGRKRAAKRTGRRGQFHSLQRDVGVRAAHRETEGGYHGLEHQLHGVAGAGRHRGRHKRQVHVRINEYFLCGVPYRCFFIGI